MPLPHGHRPRRRFGQHFLTRPDLAQRIVDLAELGPGDTALEIGPGHGALTARLAATGARVVAVEIDRDLCAALRDELTGDAVQIVEADVLAVDLDRLLPTADAVAVGNLPYNVATPVLMKLLETPARFRRLVLMLQREVAERLRAGPGTRAYGALSVAVQLVAETRIAFRVPASAFVPPPRVESAVVVITPRVPPPLSAATLARVRAVTRGVFSHRRKQLGNALRAVTPRATDALARAGIDPRRRPETLAPDELVALASAVDEVT